MRKWIVWSALVAMLALTACGSQPAGGGSEPAGASNGSAAAPEASAEEPKAAEGEKVKLSFWYIDTGKRQEIIQDAVEKFMGDHPNVEVEAVQIPNDAYKTKLSVAMGGGTPPDVFHSWGGGWLKAFANEGQVLDLTGKIDESKFLPAGLGVAKFDDKVYGAPMAMSLVPVYYNKEIFAKYNLQPPETYDELLAIVDKLNAEGVIPFAMANKTKWPAAFFLMYFAERYAGPEIFTEAFERTGRGFDDEGYVKAGEMIQELVNRNAFNPGFNGLQYDTGQSRQLLYTGKAAMEVQTSGYINNVREESPDFEAKLGMFPFPAIEGGKGDRSNLVGGVSPVLSVSAASKHPEEAIALIDALTSVEVGQRFADEASTISAINGVQYNNEFAKQQFDMLTQAKFMQTFYDQTLPPELAELHKDTTQALFGLTMTPEEAAQQMEAKAKEVLE